MNTTFEPTLETLTKQQREFFDRIENENGNFFLNGKPGVGKSVLIRALTTFGQKSWYVAAPTGLAALNAGGRTLHSLFGIPVSDGIIDPTFNNFTTNKTTLANLKYNLRYLLIDEISMVRADQFDYVDRLLRFVKNKPDLAFGGVQVVVVGDFFQLPPIVRSQEKIQFKEAGYESEFVFDAKAFEGFDILTLNEVLRQKGDNKFINLLHEARTGDVSPKNMVLLNDRVEREPEDIRVRLCATNAQADEINRRELNKLSGESVKFSAIEYGNWPAYPAELNLELKIGAQVMVRKNRADRAPDHEGPFESDVVNGTLGRIAFIYEPPLSDDPTDDYQGPDKFVVVELADGSTRKIYVQRWERKVKEKDETTGEWSETVVASFEQMPLSLAWAISMHKSQGQTFEAVHIDASKIFAAGQFYVALSRCKTLDGVTLENRINRNRIYADKRVAKFFESIEV